MVTGKQQESVSDAASRQSRMVMFDLHRAAEERAKAAAIPASKRRQQHLELAELFERRAQAIGRASPTNGEARPGSGAALPLQTSVNVARNPPESG